MSDITVIGGIIGEIEGHPYGQLIHGDQNGGTICVSYSGNGRNIAENLARLGADTAFAAAAGDDFVGRGAKLELKELGVDTENLVLHSGENTAMHISLLNIIDLLEMAVGNFDVFKRVDSEAIDAWAEKLNKCKAVAADGTFEPETMKHLIETVNVPLFFDPATAEDAKKVKEHIGKFHTILPDRLEASAIYGKDILSEEELKEAGQWFIDQGVKRVFITMSGGGVYYREGTAEGIVRPKELKVKANETGAGAAFTAAVLDAFVKDMTLEETVSYAMAAAEVSMESKDAVNPEMSLEKVGECNA